jgi:hypothetical protein
MGQNHKHMCLNWSSLIFVKGSHGDFELWQIKKQNDNKNLKDQRH